ncbi:hypoxia-inducible factor 2 alpha [Mytilus galloprovincialis]|uniref:Hypoxia-inducible factor 2 alpha n=1 Tax=Mytilus galloprovincialis TaxID=29158 RepID=A0A8B6HKG6_MYTGA|nr:hypoxia-inducible factor 2 alpha [Mytilus galloprovincialis]
MADANRERLKPLLDEDSSPDIVDDDDDEMMETQGGTKHRKLTRAEKSKNAAKNRRDKEAVEFNNIIEALPFPNEDLEKMDKSSVVKLTTSYLKMLELIDKEMKSLKIDNKVKEKETAVCKSVSSNEIVLSNGTPMGESQLMLEALNGFLILLDRKRKILFVSKNVEDHLGISQVQLIGKTVEDFIEEKDIPELRKQFNLKFMSQSHRCESMEADDIYHQLDEHRMFYVRMLCQYKNNKTKYKGHTLVQWTGRLKMRKTNKANNFATTGLLCTCKVMQTNSILEIKMDGNMFMSRHDLGMTFTFCDPRIITLIGYEPSEVIGRTAYQFHNPLDAERVRNCHSNLIVQGSSVSKYYRFVGKNCDWVWMQTRATIIYNTNNVPQYIVCMNYIISEEEGVRVLMEEDKECLSCTGVMEISSKPVKVKDSSKGDNPDHHSDNGYHSSYSPYSSINPSPLSESSMSHKQFESDDCGGGDANDDFPMSVVQECASSLDPDGADDEEMIKFIESLDSESDMAKNIQQLADNVQWNRGHSSQMDSSKKRSLQRIKSCPQVLSLLPINDSDVDDQPIQFTCRPSGTAFFQDPANQLESSNNLGNNFEIPKPGLLNIQIGSFNDGNLGGSSTLTEALPKEISDFCMQYAESMADIQSQDVMMQYGHDSLFPDLEGLNDHSGRIGCQSMNGSGIASPGSQHSYGSPQPLQNNTQTVIPNSQTVIPNTQTVIQNSQTVIPNSQIVMMNGQTVMPSTQIVISNTQTVMPNTQPVLISQSMLQNPNSVLNTQSVLLNSQPVLSNTSPPMFPTSPQYFTRNSDTPNSYLSGSSVMSPPQSYSNLNSPMSVESNISSPQGEFSNIQSPNPQAHACTIGLNNLTMNSGRSPSHNYMPRVNPSQNQQNFVGHRMNGNMDRNMLAKMNSGNNMSQGNIGNHIVNNHVKTNGHSLLHNGASQQVLSRMAPPPNQQSYQQNKAQINTTQMASGRSSSTCVAPNFAANNPSKGLRNVKSMSELEKMLRGYSPPFLSDKQSGSAESSCTLLQQMLTGKLSGEKYIAMEKQRQLNGVIRTSHK